MEIVRGTVRTLVYRVGGIFVWALIGVVTARELSVAERGTYASMVVLLFIFAALAPNISSAAGYFVSKQGRPPGEVMTASLLLAAVASMFQVAILAGWGFARWDDRTLVPIIALGIFPQVARLALSSVFLGTGHLGRQALGTHGQAYWALLFIGVWVVALDHRTAEHALGAYVAAQYVALVGLILLADREWRREMWRWPSRSFLRAMVLYGSLPGVATLVAMVNHRLGQILVIRLDGAEAAGIYASAVTIAEGLWLLSSSVSTATFHKIGTLPSAEAGQLTARTFRNLMPIILLPAIAIFALAPWLIAGVYGERYTDGATALRILCVASVLFAPVSLFSTYFMVQLGRPVVGLLLTSVSAVVTLSLSFVFIPRIGYEGAAWGALAGYGSTVAIALALFLRMSHLPARELWRVTGDDLDGYRTFARRLLRRGRIEPTPAPVRDPGSPA